MTALARHTCLELRGRLREMLPRALVRRAVLIVVAACVGASWVAFLTLPVAVATSARGDAVIASAMENVMKGVLVVATVVALGATTAAAGSALRESSRARLLALAPLGGGRFTAFLLAPIVAWSAIPFVVLDAPFALLAARVAPLVALRGLVLAIATAGLAAALALLAVVAMTRAIGRASAARVASSAGFAVSLLGVIALGPIARAATIWLPRGAGFAVLLAGPALLAPAARAFAPLLTTAAAPSAAREPRWDRAPYLRLLQRAGVTYGLFGFVPAALLLTRAPELRRAAVACLGVAFVLATLERAFAAEAERPLRWQLAPAAARVRRAILARVGGAAAAVGLVPALAVGGAAWLASLAALLVASVLSFAIEPGLLRRAGHAALIAAAVLSERLA